MSDQSAESSELQFIVNHELRTNETSLQSNHARITYTYDRHTFDHVTLEDVDVIAVAKRALNAISSPIAVYSVNRIKGIPLSKISSRDLRTLCGKLSISGYKNKRKADMAELIACKKLGKKWIHANEHQGKISIPTKTNLRTNTKRDERVHITNQQTKVGNRSNTIIDSDAMERNVQEIQSLQMEKARLEVEKAKSEREKAFLEQWSAISDRIDILQERLQIQSNEHKIQEIHQDIKQLLVKKRQLEELM